MTPPFLPSSRLSAARLAHGFFSREGGVSEGIYASLNTGPGSKDAPDHVAQNRARCADVLGVTANRLLTAYQIHSPDVIIVNAPFVEERPKVDAMVTAESGLAIGVLTADCMPFLFADPDAGVIGAAHAGWRGALGPKAKEGGVLEATINAMISLGAAPQRIIGAVGPCLRQPNFEVGLDLVTAFTDKHPEAEQFFAPGRTPEKRQFNLVGFGLSRLHALGVDQVDDLDVCTLGEKERYFSYRASQRAGHNDYGRNLSAITL